MVPSAPSAPAALAPGARVILRQPVEDVSPGTSGRMLQLGADGLANVDFGTDAHPRERRVPLAHLQPAK